MTKNQNCLITGCSGYLGHHIAQTLLKSGWDIFGTTTSKSNDDPSINWIKLNFLETHWLAGLKTALSGKSINAIIHCAAISIDANIQDIDAQNMQDSNQINLHSILKINQELLPQLTDIHVILIGSRIAKSGNAGQTLYAMAKGFMIDYTKNSAILYGEKNHKINLLIPGVHPSKLLGDQHEKIINNAKNQSVLHRTTHIEDVTNAVLFLLQSKSISGQVIEIESRFIP